MCNLFGIPYIAACGKIDCAKIDGVQYFSFHYGIQIVIYNKLCYHFVLNLSNTNVSFKAQEAVTF